MMSAEKNNQSEVIYFMSNYLNIPIEKINLDQSLFHDLGVDGDDAAEILEAYSSRFNVSLTEFEFDKYFGPEGSSLLSLVLGLITKTGLKEKARLTIADLVNGSDLGRLK